MRLIQDEGSALPSLSVSLALALALAVGVTVTVQGEVSLLSLGWSFHLGAWFIDFMARFWNAFPPTQNVLLACRFDVFLHKLSCFPVVHWSAPTPPLISSHGPSSPAPFLCLRFFLNKTNKMMVNVYTSTRPFSYIATLNCPLYVTLLCCWCTRGQNSATLRTLWAEQESSSCSGWLDFFLFIYFTYIFEHSFYWL